ncbi:MAG: hypothetical protein AAFO04_18405 [Cyanobacteria bacterium J06592_8]
MIQTTHKRSDKSSKRGRIFKQNLISSEELTKRDREWQLRHQKAKIYFYPLQKRLKLTHWLWYVAIEPETGIYMLDSDFDALVFRIPVYFPNSQLCVYQI